jgi:predicted nucleic acid-binding Zn ribbon protein
MPDRFDRPEHSDLAGQADRDDRTDQQLRIAREALAAARNQARAKGIRPPAPGRPETAGAAERASAGRADPAAPRGTAAAPIGNESAQQDVTSRSDVRTELDAATGQPTRSDGRSPAATRAAGAGTRPGFAAQRRADDPQPLASAIDGLISAEGWGLAAATGSVFGRWAQIVGRDLAAHTAPQSLTDGELIVTADSTAWATQVRLLAAELVRRLNTELGDGTVLRVKVRGPAFGERRPGQWRVRGSRGPRDTYG